MLLGLREYKVRSNPLILTGEKGHTFHTCMKKYDFGTYKTYFLGVGQIGEGFIHGAKFTIRIK